MPPLYADKAKAMRSQGVSTFFCAFLAASRSHRYLSYVTYARSDQPGLKGAGLPTSGATVGSHFAVDGMNCAKPCAPAVETVLFFHQLSVWICAAKTDTGASSPHTMREARINVSRC